MKKQYMATRQVYACGDDRRYSCDSIAASSAAIENVKAQYNVNMHVTPLISGLAPFDSSIGNNPRLQGGLNHGAWLCCQMRQHHATIKIHVRQDGRSIMHERQSTLKKRIPQKVLTIGFA